MPSQTIPVMSTPRYPTSIREEELKNRVAKDFFEPYDTTRIIGNIDFCVAVPAADTLFEDETESIVWAEAKEGTSHSIVHSFVQLILTIGKARNTSPPSTVPVSPSSPTTVCRRCSSRTTSTGT